MPPSASLHGWPVSAVSFASPAPALSADAELKAREIASKLELLARKQAARESAAGRIGVGQRQVLAKRLKELQREKHLKQQREQADAQAGSPIGVARLGAHSSPTADGAASLEAAEKLRQAKAKYWSNLDQMAPDWKSNTQQRRMDQLAKYETAIDALLVRRQAASLAYAKERELQKLLTAKQAELHGLAMHERDEVRVRQSARQEGRGGAGPSPLSPQQMQQQRDLLQREQLEQQLQQLQQQQLASYPPPQHHISPHRPHSSGARSVSPQSLPQAHRSSADVAYARASEQYSPSHSHHSPPLAARPSTASGLHARLRSDAEADREYSTSRLSAAQQAEAQSLEAWRADQARELELRASRVAQRELESAREKRLAMDRRRALEAEQDALVRGEVHRSSGSYRSPPLEPSLHASYPSDAIHTRADRGDIAAGPASHYDSPRAAGEPQTQFDALSSRNQAASIHRDEPSVSHYEREYSPSARARSVDDPFAAQRAADDREREDRRVREADAIAQRQREDDDRRRRDQEAQQQQQAEAERRRQEENDRDRERERQAQQARAQLEAADAKARAAAAAAAAEAEARRAAAVDAPRVSAAATPAAIPAEVEIESVEKKSGLSGLFSGLGSSLGFMGKKKKAPTPTAAAAAASAASSKPQTATASKPATAAAAPSAAKSKSSRADSDDSSEDETELRMPAPAVLSSAMLKKKPLARTARRPPSWQTNGDDEGDDIGGGLRSAATAKGTLPEDDEFAF